MVRLLKHIILVVLTMLTVGAYAQQDPLFTQYMNNPGLINPAYAGSRGVVAANGVFRKQWVNQDWSPTTTTLSINSPFRDYKVGLGFTFVDDRIGPLAQTGIYIDYAYFLDLSKGRNLSLGIKGGFNFYDRNLTNLTMYEYDPLVSYNPRNTAFLPNFGVGLFYFTNDYFVGISVPKLVRNSISDSDNTLEVLGREERHVFFTAGGVITIDDPVWKLKPTAMLRMVNGSPVSVEFGATVIFYERVWFGLTYRLGDESSDEDVKDWISSRDRVGDICAHVRWQVSDRFQIGYSYDFINSQLRYYNNGSHEIFLSYEFAGRDRRIQSPRYF